MNNAESFTHFKKRVVIASIVLLLIYGFASQSQAVTRFSTGTREKRMPAPLRFDDIWFYSREDVKVIPEISSQWLTVVFRSSGDGSESPILDEAKTIMSRHPELVDLFYDNNLAEDACFFKLPEGMKRDALLSLLKELNSEMKVDYTHPTITLHERTYAFFNVFEMKWKTGMEEREKENLMKQARVSFDEEEGVCRVDIYEVPFFKALNLFAEDIAVLEITPYLVELKPSVSAVLLFPLHGGNIGDTIPFSFVVEFSDRISIDPSSLANIDLRPTAIQKDLFEVQFDPYDYVKASSASPIRISGWMRFYAPGEYIIPSLKVKYTCSSCSGGEVRSIETAPVHFRISSIIPSQQKGSTLIVPADRLIPDYRLGEYHSKGNRHLFISLLSFLLALGCLVWFALNIRALRIEQSRAREKKKEEIVLERLKNLLDFYPSEPHWSYLMELGNTLREYLVAKYHLSHDPHGGSGEVFFDTIRHTLSGTWGERLHLLLKEIDNSIAGELGRYPDLEHLKSEMREIIDAL